MKLLKFTCLIASYLVLISVFIGCKEKDSYPSLIDKRTYLFEEIQSHGTLSTSKAFNKEIQDSLSMFLDSMQMFLNISSMSVAIGIPDVGVWSAVRQNNDDENRIDTNTIFHAESTGKIYTSVLILKLVEQGVLSLDTSIDKWFSYIPKSDKITIRDLLMHTSGIPSFESCKEYDYTKVYQPMEKVLWSLKYPFLFEPGTSFSYSNTGYILLGLIAEQATGKSFEELLQQNIISPLGLKYTYAITFENKDTLITLKGHKGGKEIILMEDVTGPSFSGYIASTPKDQIVFLQALMSGRLISKESVEDMFNEMNRFPEMKPPAYYGKGIMAMPDIPSNQFPYDLLIEHNGGSTWMGFYSYPLYVPEINMFVSVMTNDYVLYSESIKYNLANYLIKLLYKIP
ncbi:MAG: beta-lactamase family protein [Bacteroidales bacterium]|nr:beta-lactamase family protein [Bacteroidales bacterium]